MREYYIRREGDEDSSGPFDMDQIASLFEADKLDAEAYYYEIESESWEKISSNEEMMNTLFPKKKKLTLRTEDPVEEASPQTEPSEVEGADEKDSDPAEGAEQNPEAESTQAAPSEEKPAEAKKKDDNDGEREKLEVTKMLALAEGRANDPSGKSPREKQAAVAYYGLRAITLYFLASVFAMGFIEKDLIMTANAIEMAKSPYVIIGVFDVIMIVILLLQVTEVYPLLRFRAAIGAGLISMLFYASGDYLLLASNLLLMIAIYFSSSIIKIRYLIAFTVVGVVGAFGYIYSFLLS